MEKIAILNAKGGVGKTTSTINIGAVLAERGKKVLILDMDPQMNTTNTYVNEDREINYTLSDLFLQNVKDVNEVIIESNVENIDIIPCDKSLKEVETYILFNSTTRSTHHHLDKIMKGIKKEYDYCLIDCPPAINRTVANVLVTCDKVLVPIKIDKYALDGLGELLDSIEEVKEEFNPNLVLLGCFITMDNATNVNKQIKETLKNKLDNLLFDTSIRQNVAIVESTFMQIPVTHYSGDANASIDYRNLVDEVLGDA